MRARSSIPHAVRSAVEQLEQRRLLAAWFVADPAFGADGLADFAPQIRGTYVLAAPQAGGKIVLTGRRLGRGG